MKVLLKEETYGAKLGESLREAKDRTGICLQDKILVMIWISFSCNIRGEIQNLHFLTERLYVERVEKRAYYDSCMNFYDDDIVVVS